MRFPTAWAPRRGPSAAIVLALTGLGASGCDLDTVAPRRGVSASVATLTTVVNGPITATLLPAPAGESLAWAINDAGIVVGQAEVSSGGTTRWTAATWVGGVLQPLAGPSGNRFSDGRAISPAGLVAGLYAPASGPAVGATWSGGTFSASLASPPGKAPNIVGVLDDGRVLGDLLQLDNLSGTAVIWTGGNPVPLPMPAGYSANDWATALGANDLGDIAGYIYSWSSSIQTGAVWSGGTALLLTGLNYAADINNLGWVAGSNGTDAVVWKAGVTTLLPRPAGAGGGSGCSARAINDAGDVVGECIFYSATLSTNVVRAVLWRAGQAYDLGDLGAGYSFAKGINASGQIVGYTQDFVGGTYAKQAVMWTVATGNTQPGSEVAVTPVDPVTGQPSTAVSVSFGQVTGSGNTTVTTSSVGGGGGPPAPSTSQFRLGSPATIYDITTDAGFTGSITICINYGGSQYGNESKLKLLHYEGGAWVNVTTSLDTINDVVCGTVSSLSPFLAVEQNEAPVISSITLPGAPLRVGATAAISAAFTDANPLDLHSGSVAWGDGSSSAATVTESAGAGSASASHGFASPGLYAIGVSVSDGGLQGSRSSTSDLPSYIAVYDPDAGSVTGGGWIDSPAGALRANPILTGQARLELNPSYPKGASTPDGNGEFRFDAASLRLRVTGWDWLVVQGNQAISRGTGTLNGAPGYGFLVSVTDGDGTAGRKPDQVRVRIWSLAAGTLVYDNQPGAPDGAGAGTALSGGNLTVRKP